MKKLAGAAVPSITLVLALVMLFVGLAAFLLANSLRVQLQETRGQLKEAQGQLEETQGELQQMQAAKDLQQKTAKAGAGAAGRQPSTTNESQPQANTKDRVQDPKSSTQQGQDNNR